jgi:hypothetical protein
MCYRGDDCVEHDTCLQSRRAEGDVHAVAASDVGFSYTRAQKKMISHNLDTQTLAAVCYLPPATWLWEMPLTPPRF